MHENIAQEMTLMLTVTLNFDMFCTVAKAKKLRHLNALNFYTLQSENVESAIAAMKML